MKVIYLMDKSKHYIEDTLADKIISNIDNLKFVKLPSGAFINTNQITKIDFPEKKPYFMGFPMTDDLNFVIKQGEKVKFDKAYIRQIDYKEELPPKLKDNLLENNY